MRVGSTVNLIEPAALDTRAPAAAEARVSTHELSLLRRALERHSGAAAAVHDLRDLVEVADPHKLLMLHGFVALALRREFPGLQVGICGHAALFVVLRQGEHGVVQRMEARESHELEFVAHFAQLLLEACELRVVEMPLPVEGWRTVVGE